MKCLLIWEDCGKKNALHDLLVYQQYLQPWIRNYGFLPMFLFVQRVCLDVQFKLAATYCPLSGPLSTLKDQLFFISPMKALLPSPPFVLVAVAPWTQSVCVCVFTWFLKETFAINDSVKPRKHILPNKKIRIYFWACIPLEQTPGRRVQSNEHFAGCAWWLYTRLPGYCSSPST